tara:strand:+ start:25062 stop:25928 length:867 start_codon:yes stop_codon:yes gene_type:complete
VEVLMKYPVSRTSFLFYVILALQACFSTAALAQWPLHMDGVPLLPDGTPDLNAPAPRTLDGKPDLSGVWDFPFPHQSGEQGRPVGEPRQPPPGVAPYATFWDQGFGFENGLPYQPWAREKRAERMANNGIENPDSFCLPLGHMQFHTHPQPNEIIQSENRLVILYEASAGVREIFLDGRPLPPQGEPLPTWYGYSVGHWEGDTLVVQTNNFRGDGWLDFNGSPTTEQLVITERFRRVSYGRLELDINIDDPGAYTEDFDLRINFDIMPGDSLIEWVCENEASVQYFSQ